MTPPLSPRGRPIAPTLDSILRPRDLVARLGLSRVTIWRMQRRGEFPAPIRLSPGCIGWRVSDVIAWLDRRAGGQP